MTEQISKSIQTYKRTVWSIVYENVDEKLTHQFAKEFIHYYPGFQEIGSSDEETTVLELVSNFIYGNKETTVLKLPSDVSSVNMILLIREFVEKHPEFKKGAKQFDLINDSHVIKKSDLREYVGW